MSQVTAIVVILLALAIDEQKPLWLSLVGLLALNACLVVWAGVILWRENRPTPPAA